jgi:hypothetical protein
MDGQVGVAAWLLLPLHEKVWVPQAWREHHRAIKDAASQQLGAGLQGCLSAGVLNLAGGGGVNPRLLQLVPLSSCTACVARLGAASTVAPTLLLGAVTGPVVPSLLGTVRGAVVPPLLGAALAVVPSLLQGAATRAVVPSGQGAATWSPQEFAKGALLLRLQECPMGALLSGLQEAVTGTISMVPSLQGASTGAVSSRLQEGTSSGTM